MPTEERSNFILLIFIAMIVYLYVLPTTTKNKYVGPPYCWAEMHTVRMPRCMRITSHGDADGTDRRTDARPLHYSFR